MPPSQPRKHCPALWAVAGSEAWPPVPMQVAKAIIPSRLSFARVTLPALMASVDVPDEVNHTIGVTGEFRSRLRKRHWMRQGSDSAGQKLGL